MKPTHTAAPYLTALLLTSMPAVAAADPLSDLRTELDALKASYDNRIQLLEQRIAQLETANAESANTDRPDDSVAALPPQPALPLSTASGGSGANAFNPAISLILGGSYTQTSIDPARYQIAGFIPSGGESGPGARSFNLGESELTIAANVDPYFFGALTASFDADNELSVEEAFFRTTALPDGFTLKGGRFFSALGYLNEVHAHAWDFVDQPLVYQALLGGQYTQDGLQLRWLAPTDVFMEFGLESGGGRNFPATPRSANGLNGASAFLHMGNDIGDSASWRAGVSWLRASAEDRRYSDLDAAGAAVTNAFTGSSQTWVADFTWKWAPHGNPTERQLKLQGEYVRRSENGSLVFDVDARALTGAYRSRQSGWYAQGVYQFAPRWRVGLRYDSLDSRDPRVGADFPLLQSASPRRTTLMLDWNLSEFSRLRSQLAWDEARRGETDKQLFLQYIFSLGAHGAHKF